jgi:hypothetical protein
MQKPFLTRLRRSTDDRRAATCLMTVVSLLVSPLALAQGDERAPSASAAPSSLIERALQPLSEGSVSERAMAAATLIPELRLRAMFSDATWTGYHQFNATIVGELAWPLGRTPVGAAVDEARVRRQRSAERKSVVDQIAASWRERRRAEEMGDDIAAELAAEEADADAEALTEDEP